MVNKVIYNVKIIRKGSTLSVLIIGFYTRNGCIGVCITKEKLLSPIT